jgi:PleD family two-component response regulator
MAKKVVEVVRTMNLPHLSSPKEHVTLSAGCATTSPPVMVSGVKRVEHADHALYKAKREGRDGAKGMMCP